MNKKIACLCFAALVASTSLPAQTPAPASSYSVTVDFPYASRYVFRGIKYAEGSFQPSVKLAVGDMYLGIWTNQPITHKTENEVDYFAGYNIKLNDKWTLDAGGTLYYYPELNTSGGADKSTFEGYLGLNGSLGEVSVGVYSYYDFTLKAFTLQGTLGHSFTIDDKTSFNVSGTVGNVSPDAGSSYTYYSLGFTVPYKLTDTATFTVGGNWASHDLEGVEDSHLWFTTALTVTF